MPIDLTQWRHLVAVAEHGSFVRAAAAVGLSQPALSRSIQGLERELGAPMFDRTTTGSIPTDFGRVTIARARDLVRMADDLDREARSRRSLQTGQVVVGAGPFPAETVISRAAAAFNARHPHVSLQFPTRPWEELLRMLRARSLDFFVAERSLLPEMADVEVEPLPTAHPLFFFARPGHPLFSRREFSLEDVFDWSIIAPSRIPPRVLEPMLKIRSQRKIAGGPPKPFPAIDCGSLTMQLRIVERSDAIAVSPIEVVADSLERGRVALLATEPWLHLACGIARLAGRPLTSAAERFRADVIAAEEEATREEERLLARWGAAGSHGRPRPGPGPSRAEESAAAEAPRPRRSGRKAPSPS